MSHTPTDSGISALVADARNCAAKPDTMLQLWRSKLTRCADLIEAQAAELATLRAERDALKTGILPSAGAEYILDHPMETDVERMGRHSAVRGMMVRLGLYPQLEQAIDDAIALKGGA